MSTQRLIVDDWQPHPLDISSQLDQITPHHLCLQWIASDG